MLDLAYIHLQLSQSYWSEGIPRSVVEKAILGSLCFGIYAGSLQVGFARLVTDEATFAYLADVFIDEAHRGQGLGKKLVQYIMDLEFMPQLRRISLATRDAHGLYAQFGFSPPTNCDRWMEIARPDMYLKSPNSSVQ